MAFVSKVAIARKIQASSIVSRDMYFKRIAVRRMTRRAATLKLVQITAKSADFDKEPTDSMLLSCSHGHGSLFFRAYAASCQDQTSGSLCVHMCEQTLGMRHGVYGCQYLPKAETLSCHPRLEMGIEAGRGEAPAEHFPLRAPEKTWNM